MKKNFLGDKHVSSKRITYVPLIVPIHWIRVSGKINNLLQIADLTESKIVFVF